MILRSTTLIASLLLSSSYAQALEGKALLDKFVQQAAEGGHKISWQMVNEEDSRSFVLTDVLVEPSHGQAMKIQNVVVRGLEEKDGRISYDALTLVNLSGDTRDGGKIAIKGIASANGDVPFAIWEGGLSAEEKRERIKFGNFTINGVAISNDETALALDAIAMTNADLPLDFRYTPEQINAAAGSAPVAPMRFDQFAITGLSGSQQGVSFGMKSLSIADANIPTGLDATMHDWMKMYRAVSINGIAASLGETEVFAMNSMTGTISPADQNGTVSSTSQIDGIVVNLQAVPDANTQAIAKQLGYEKIEASMSGVSDYNPDSGMIVVRDTILKLKDMFDMSFDYKVMGYTSEIAQKFNQAQLKAESSPNPMAVYMGLMEELKPVTLESLKISLTDQSLTEKLLDFQAQQMGTTGDQLAAGAPMMISLGLGQLQMPELTEMVSNAVGTFLKDKGTLTVEATPTQPVSIVDIFVAGQNDPKQIPDMVNLNISAQ